MVMTGGLVGVFGWITAQMPNATETADPVGVELPTSPHMYGAGGTAELIAYVDHFQLDKANRDVFSTRLFMSSHFLPFALQHSNKMKVVRYDTL